MANYINLTLDTVGPQGVTLLLNNGETVTTSNAIEWKVSCADTDTTGYQMKMWGTAACPTEEKATWETFISSDMSLIRNAAGLKTIYVKLRDDVYNESATISATINYVKDRPTVQGLFVSPAKLSLIDGKNVAAGGFNFNETIDAVKIMIVSDVNATYDNPSNISIPTTNGSSMWDDLTVDPYNISTLESEIAVPPEIPVGFYINAKDISAVAPGDGVKIIKVFVRSALSGLWSL